MSKGLAREEVDESPDHRQSVWLKPGEQRTEKHKMRRWEEG